MKMKYFALLIVFLTSLGFAQNGPSPAPKVVLSWTQSTSSGVTGNCVYRGSAAGSYTLPALFCSTAPVITYTDTTVLNGQTYHYAVTALSGSGESAYSNDFSCAIPTIPAAPTGLGATVTAGVSKSEQQLSAKITIDYPDNP